MGEPMATNLLAGGHALSVYDIDKDRMDALARAGATVCGNAREVAQNADIVFLMVLSPEDVESAIFGNDGAIEGLVPGNLVVCMSSIPTDVTRDIAARLAEREIGMVDAPVSGGRAGAAAGSLAIMAGGEERDFNRVLAYLKLMGDTITLVGGSGSGQTAKAANQIIVTLTRAAVGEAILFATRNGANPERIIAALSGGLADGRTLQSYGPRIAGQDNPVEFGSPILKKDINNIVEAAQSAGIELPFASLAREMYNSFES